MVDFVDPWYSNGVGLDIRQLLRELGVSLVVNGRMGSKCAVDRDEQVIWVCPGLELPDLHQAISRAFAHVRWGPEVSGATTTAPEPERAVSSGAVVVPLPQRWMRGRLG